MTMQSEQQDVGFLNSLAGQMMLLTGGLVIVLTVAWFFVF